MVLIMSFRFLILPLLTLGLLLWSQTQLSGLSGEYLELAQQIPLVILVLATALGVIHKQSAVVFISVLLGAGYYLLNNTIPSAEAAQQPFYQAALYILLPLNIALLAILPDRGVLTASGRRKIVFITAQVLAIALLPKEYSKPFMLIFQSELFHWLKQIPVGQFALTGWLVATALLLPGIRRNTTPLRSAMLGLVLLLPVVVYNPYYEITSWLVFTTTAALLLFTVIQNGYRMAFVDQLTGLPNRRALDNRFARLPGKYTIAMLDVDHFKKFNDTWGHDVGDQVLRMVASKMKHIGGGGKAARYGGEEFTVVFSGKTKKECREHLEELRERIENTSFMVRKNRTSKRAKAVSVTISIGMCERSQSRKAVDQVVKGADQALYRAKKAGRNCVR